MDISDWLIDSELEIQTYLESQYNHITESGLSILLTAITTKM